MQPWWAEYNFVGKLIGIVGKGRSGKDTAAAFATDHRAHIDMMAFAKPLKDFAREVYQFTEDQLYGEAKDLPDKRYLLPKYDGLWEESDISKHPERFLTPRTALQRLGDEWGRGNCRYTWLQYLARQAAERLAGARIAEKGSDAITQFSTTGASSSIIKRTDLIIVTDCRYVNEADAIKKLGGTVWRATRPGFGLEGEAAQHRSELEQDSPEMDALVDVELINDGTLEAFSQRVKTALEML
jgi:hypothetical protein